MNFNMKYEFSILNMKCSNCVGKIEKKLKSNENVIRANVNLIMEKALVLLKSMPEENIENVLTGIKLDLEKIGFKTGKIVDLNKKANSRILKLEIKHREPVNFYDEFRKVPGVLKVKHFSNISKKSKKYYYEYEIEYDCLLTRGWEVYDKLEKIIKGENPVNGGILNTEGNESPKPKDQNNIQTTAADSIITPRLDIPKYKYINSLAANVKEMSHFQFSTDKLNLAVCLILTLFLIILSIFGDYVMIQKYLLDNYIYIPQLSLYLIIISVLSFYIIVREGFPLYLKATKNYYNARSLNMDTLIAMGSFSSLVLAIFLYFKFFLSSTMAKMLQMEIAHALIGAATILSISLIGKNIEERAKSNIRKRSNFQMKNLNENQFANWIKPQNKQFKIMEQKQINVGLIEKDEFAMVKEGELLLFDCIVLHGEIEINENIQFGTDTLNVKRKGDKLKSGCEIKKGSSIVLVENVLEESLLFKVTEEMSLSLNQKLQFQNSLDKVITWFVPCILIISVIIWIVWALIYLKYAGTSEDYHYLTWSFVIERGIAFLVASCPCAFGLAIPTVTTIILNKALQYGILIKNLAILPDVKNVDYILFDKTGTLTEVIKGINVEFQKIDLKFDESSIYEIICLIEQNQTHPMAQHIYSFCFKNMNPKSVNNIIMNSDPIILSNGIKAILKFNDDEIPTMLGNYEFMINNGMLINETYNSNLYNIYKDSLKTNMNIVFFCIDYNVKLVLSIDSSSDLRKESFGVVKQLMSADKNVYILSGDNKESVIEVGKKLGLKPENAIGGVDNNDKKNFILKLKQEKKKKILMIGDGLNDILSFSEADFGISFNANSQLNMISSDVIFVKEDLCSVLILIKLSKLAHIFICINIFWAFFYNLLMLPMSAGVFHFFIKFEMSPSLSSFAMLLSSLLILATSNIIRCFKVDKFKKETAFKTRKEHLFSTNASFNIEMMSKNDQSARGNIIERFANQKKGYFQIQ